MPLRRHALALLAAALTLAGGPVGAALPPDDAATVERIQRHLSSITTLQARFEQLNPDGSISSGTLHIQRPGKMRFDYDPPSQILLIATDWRLIFWDGSIEQQNVIPISQTPLGFLLGRSAELDAAYEVIGVSRRYGEIDVTLVLAENPDAGSATVTFADEPLELRRWSVLDAQGLVTRVLLEDVRIDQPVDPKLFVWRDPQVFGPPRD
jgi:outer membrane lipoprotein-sorting protein